MHVSSWFNLLSLMKIISFKMEITFRFPTERMFNTGKLEELLEQRAPVTSSSGRRRTRKCSPKRSMRRDVQPEEREELLKWKGNDAVLHTLKINEKREKCSCLFSLN